MSTECRYCPLHKKEAFVTLSREEIQGRRTNRRPWHDDLDGRIERPSAIYSVIRHGAARQNSFKWRTTGGEFCDAR